MPPWLLLCAVVACLGSVAAPAAAQRNYQTTIRDAVSEYSAGNLEESRALFEQAHRMKPSARTLRGLGMVAFEQKRYVQAVDYLEQALADSRKPLKRRNRVKAKDLLSRAASFVGTFTVKLVPGHAQLAVDGASVTLRDGQLRLKIGGHTISATADGHEPSEQSLQVRGAEHGEISITLQAIAAAAVVPPAEPATPVVPTDEPQRVEGSQESGVGTVDGQSSGLLPWLLVGGGVAVGIAGTVLGVIAQSRADEVEDKCPTMRCDNAPLEDTADSAETLGMAATVLWIAGGAIAATGVVLLLLGDDNDEQAGSARATVVLTPTHAGLLLEGTF